MARYRILIWSGRRRGLVDHDTIMPGEATGEPLLERIHAAGRAALGLALGMRAQRQAEIAAASGHIREALRLLDGLASLPSARRLARRMRLRR